MNDYILFMHGDTSDGRRNRGEDEWTAYFAKLRQAGVFQGGSAIGEGVCVSKPLPPRPTSRNTSPVTSESRPRA